METAVTRREVDSGGVQDAVTVFGILLEVAMPRFRLLQVVIALVLLLLFTGVLSAATLPHAFTAYFDPNQLAAGARGSPQYTDHNKDQVSSPVQLPIIRVRRDT